MIITIDGPGGVGKSTLARDLAEELGFEVLDTGAMFRALAYYAVKQNIEPADLEKREAFKNLSIVVEGGRCLLNGEDISAAIRSPEISRAASAYAAQPYVRGELKALQQEFARGRSIVAEGRDMGSQVFPHAELKFYLDATSPVRARRRRLQLLEQGIDEPLEKILAEIEERDMRDRTRSAAPLVVPENAVLVDTDNLGLEQVFALMRQKAQERMKK